MGIEGFYDGATMPIQWGKTPLRMGDFSWLCNDFRNRLRDFYLNILHIIEIIIVTLPHKNRKY